MTDSNNLMQIKLTKMVADEESLTWNMNQLILFV